LDGVKSVAITPDGRFLAVGGERGKEALWIIHRLSDSAVLKEAKGHVGFATALAIEPRGRLLASGNSQGSVWLLQFPDDVPIKRLDGHTGEVVSLAFSPDGQFLVSGSLDGTVRLWGLGLLHVESLPIGKMSPGVRTWVQETLHNEDLSDAGQSWLRFLLALIRWRWQYDIEVEIPVRRPPGGEFDIEIA
jgi:WD40 repeat protein